MSRVLYATEPGRAEIRTEEPDPLADDELRIALDLTAEKHGTTLPTFAGHRESTGHYDPDQQLFVSAEEPADPFPFHLGNMGVGHVTEMGADVDRFAVGDRVFGYGPHAETWTVTPEARLWHAPAGVPDEALVCTDPITVALLGTRYGDVCLGDRVAVFGLGAIGLFAVQTCRLAGAMPVIAVDPIEERRELAASLGAAETIDPTAVDAGRTIKDLTDDAGVDAALEISGVHEALHHAIRGTAYGGAVVPVSYYHDDPDALALSEEWHFNRQRLVAGARVESEPYRDHPRWDRERVYETTIACLARDRLSAEGIVTTIDFEAAPAAYERLAADATAELKVAIAH